MRRTKKALAVLAALLLALSMAAGCTASTPPATTAPAQTAAATPEPTAEPPVTLTMWAPAFEKSFPAGVQDDPVAKEITAKTGVALDITPMNAVSNYADKLAAALASSDLPDIAYVSDATILPKIISAKAALAMDDYLEKYGTHILNDTPFRVEYARKYRSVDMDGKSDGKMYTWASVGDVDIDPLQVMVAPYLRYDLWKQLGYPALNSMDDYIPVLQQMMELEPTNKNGQKVYGMSSWFADSYGWNNWIFTAAFPMMYGVSLFGAHEYIEMGTNKIDSKVLDPNSAYWAGITWLNKAYRAGIMDPDAFTMKWDNYLEKTAANRVLLAFAPWCLDGGSQAFVTDGAPEKGYVQMPAPHKLDRFEVSYDMPHGGYVMFISSKTKYPEKAVTLLDYLTSIEGTELIYNGVKGVNWDDASGQPAMKADTLTGLATDPDYRIKTGVFKYHNLAGRGRSVLDPAYNAPVYFSYMPDVVATRMTDLQKEAAGHFNVQLLGDLYMKNPDIKHTVFDTTLTSLFPTAPDDIKEIETKINNYLGPVEIQVILSKTEEEFNTAKAQIIEDVKGLGGETSLQWFKDQFAILHPAK
jgi:hypothetical protein